MISRAFLERTNSLRQKIVEFAEHRAGITVAEAKLRHAPLRSTELERARERDLPELIGKPKAAKITIIETMENQVERITQVRGLTKEKLWPPGQWLMVLHDLSFALEKSAISELERPDLELATDALIRLTQHSWTTSPKRWFPGEANELMQCIWGRRLPAYRDGRTRS